MNIKPHRLICSTILATSILVGSAASAGGRSDDDRPHRHGEKTNVQVGVRPFYLVDGLDEGRLKSRLQQCEAGPFYRSQFSISHRGAPLEFPEHSRESYEAANRMGAGIIECDVSFTKDGELVCRHSECDLHTTTNIVNTPLNASCTVPWAPGGPAPKCCTSDISLSEYKSLKAKMDASNPAATTPAGYLGGTANWRTDLYTGRPAGNVVTLKEHIALIKQWGVSQTPELKEGDAARIQAVFGGQAQYAQKLIDTYKDAGVDPRKVYAQSFNINDVLYWIKQEPAFGKQAVYLDPIEPSLKIERMSKERLRELKKAGVQIIAPPMWALLALNDANEIVPSSYAMDIKAAGFRIITWSFERVNLTQGAAGRGSYYQFDPEGKAIKKDSDMLKALDVLARKVGVEGVFSDWPGTVTYYANCMGF
ncbi:MAG: glycerophosphodiester phosphodiesterase family protein [Aquabacterium sp.]|uniref:glycerophosphodiester phosphodiesterase family protein n=1 Tax=Aquabacterium sp. TaxID=1872578 RepID=UPI00272622F7|nr:glycerophosphodiester phosphodiesterase family protein [Aquabacterium sp.]MDO9002924.1 glycerophosphodiester phosphodiesterase family protein [Aquabacterium sp.]